MKHTPTTSRRVPVETLTVGDIIINDFTGERCLVADLARPMGEYTEIWDQAGRRDMFPPNTTVRIER